MMNDYYYIYTHRDPYNKYEVVYVGRGRKDRAWQCRSSQRRNDHAEFLSACECDGYNMGMLVKIEASMLSRLDALVMENELIKQHQPRFNRKQGCEKKLTQTDIADSKKDRDEGLSYSEIAARRGVSAMTVWRALND